MHLDVVEYGRKKLDEFIRQSPAIDLMDFCPPKFVVGNCLQLDAAGCDQSYDRVYCGAAVPQEHIGYIKSLVKVGGIVVMPCEDQVHKTYMVFVELNVETFVVCFCLELQNLSGFFYTVYLT